MQLELYRTLWGRKGNYLELVKESKRAGFDGIETSLPADPEKADQLRRGLINNKMKYIAEVSTCGSFSQSSRKASVDDHLNSLKEQVERCLPYNPEFINCMGGRDSWSIDQSLTFFHGSLDLEKEFDIIISHETHRGRILFNPWTSYELLRQIPQLKITCDYSHWCVVCERLLEDGDNLGFFSERAHHIHGRVGHSEGPQVSHPAAPEFAEELQAHQRWWELIWTSQIQREYTQTTLNPEYGVDGYLAETPFTQEPVADQWEIQRWVGEIERDHFSKFVDSF